MIKNTPFSDISLEESALLRSCLLSGTRAYAKNEIIIHFSSAGRRLGLVEKGLAYLVRIDVDGSRSIIDYYEEGDVFGKLLYHFSDEDEYYIIAKKKSFVSVIDYDRLLGKCERGCKYHTVFLNNIAMLSLKKLRLHVDVLSRRTTRAKLETYFRALSLELGRSFSLPMSLSDLADYLCADRSAMMREIKRLNEAGYIKSQGSKIEFL